MYSTRSKKRNSVLSSNDNVRLPAAKKQKREDHLKPSLSYVAPSNSDDENTPLTDNNVIKLASEEIASSTKELVCPTKKLTSLSKELASSTKELVCPTKKLASLSKELVSPTKEPKSPMKKMASAVKENETALLSQSNTVDVVEDDDVEDELCDYERKRLKNLRENADFFSSLGINELKMEIRRKKEKEKPKRAKNQKKSPPPPRRASLRIRRIDPEGNTLPPRPPSPEPVPEHPRKQPGPIPMEEHLLKDELEDHQNLLSKMKGLDNCAQVSELQEIDGTLSSFMKGFGSIRLRSDGVAKVVPDRVFSLAIHSSKDKVVVAAGGKWGTVGLWDVAPGREYITDGVVTYTPHSRPVNCLRFPFWAPQKIYSCSYDGTLRCGDFEVGVFDEIYSTPEEDDNLLKNFDFMSQDTILVSQQDGSVALLDTRCKGTEAENTYSLHMKSLRTVSVHPVDKHIFATGSTDGTVKLWDHRTLKKKNNREIDAIHHKKGVSSAYFSPVTGKYILSTSIDDTIIVSDASDVKKDLTVLHRINHNNHVGRWLTAFRADWHPSREDLFVVGSMQRPRRIQLYRNTGQVLKEFQSEENLGSVCSLNVIHPVRNVLVGANSSGRLHVFM